MALLRTVPQAMHEARNGTQRVFIGLFSSQNILEMRKSVGLDGRDIFRVGGLRWRSGLVITTSSPQTIVAVRPCDSQECEARWMPGPCPDS